MDMYCLRQPAAILEKILSLCGLVLVHIIFLSLVPLVKAVIDTPYTDLCLALAHECYLL